MAFLDTSSTSKQSTETVSGSGQLNKRSNVAQGGSVQLGKGAKVGVTDLSKATVGGNVTVTAGASDNLVNSLVGNLTQASTAQLDRAAQANTDSLTQFKSLVTQKNDAAAGSPDKFQWVALAAIAAVVVLAFRK